VSARAYAAFAAHVSTGRPAGSLSRRGSDEVTQARALLLDRDHPKQVNGT
jgi:hypothetical protein